MAAEPLWPADAVERWPKAATAACGDPKIPEAAFLEFEKAGQVQCPECGHVFVGPV